MRRTDSACDPNEVAVKSFFLGPSAENEEWLTGQISDFLQSWTQWRKRVSGEDGGLITDRDRELPEFKRQQQFTSDVIREISRRFEDEIPKFSPRYIGHMFSEISMPALLGHMITLLHNPNNISVEASTVGTEIEKQAIEALCTMIGYSEGVGHFTSGGTVANFEFLFRARERLSKWLAAAIATGEKDVFRASAMGWDEFHRRSQDLPEVDFRRLLLHENPIENLRTIREHLGFDLKPPVLLVSASKHYSWPKAMHYLGLGEPNVRYVKLDDKGRMSVADLQLQIEQCRLENIPLLGVVAIVGTTELGTVDPIQAIVTTLDELEREHGLRIWLHLDAAYGGFFRSVIRGEAAGSIDVGVLRDLTAMKEADSVTLDPHKLGYVPYASGAFICRDEEDYFVKSFTGPYIVSDRKNLGNFTIEGSRSAAGAVATYASLKAFEGSDGYARILSRAVSAKLEFREALIEAGLHVFFPEGLDTNLLCFAVLGKETRLSDVNRLNLSLYERCQAAGRYWISKTTLNRDHFGALIEGGCAKHGLTLDTDEMVLLRLTLMNPFVLSKEGPTDHARAFAESLQ